MTQSPICTIDATGIHRPDWATVLDFWQSQFRGIYGQDVYLGNDCQDGQWVSLIAAVLHDVNAAMVALYNNQSPDHAQGAALSSLVKLNGLGRSGASRSSVDLRLIGQAGVVIEGGAVRDANNRRWLLPATVTIPRTGEITVTATAEDAGALAAPAGTITVIDLPVPGWQSVTNPAGAAPGLPVEKDPALRQRQKLSTLIPARTLLDGTRAAVAAIRGVARHRVYENDTDRTDADGLPGKSIAYVVDGGDAFTIAATIYLRKGAVGTFGTTQVLIGDAMGVPRAIYFSRSEAVRVTYRVRLRALAGYDLDVEAAIQAAVAAWTNELGIGGGKARALLRTRAYRPALLPDSPRAETFEIRDILVARDGDTPGSGDLAFAFNERPEATADDVLIEVLP